MPISTEDLLQLSHEHINSYIKAADQKASILLSGQLAFLALSANIAEGRWMNVSYPIRVAVLLMALSGLIAVFFSAWVIYPRSKNTSSKGAMYWRNITKFGTSEEFTEYMDELESDQTNEELSNEIYAVSTIAATKHDWLKRSLGFTAIMMFFATFITLYNIYPSILLTLSGTILMFIVLLVILKFG